MGLLLAATASSSQIWLGPVAGTGIFGYQVTDGYNPSNAKFTPRVGLRLGGMVFARFTRRFALETMPCYVLNGGGIERFVSAGTTYIINGSPKVVAAAYGFKYTMHSIDIPLSLVYTRPIKKVNNFTFGFGIYYRYNLGGTAKYSKESTEDIPKEKIHFGDYASAPNKFLIMDRTGLGFLFSTGIISKNGWSGRLNWQSDLIGIGSTYPASAYDFGLTLGYMIRPGKKDK